MWKRKTDNWSFLDIDGRAGLPNMNAKDGELSAYAKARIEANLAGEKAEGWKGRFMRGGKL